MAAQLRRRGFGLLILHEVPPGSAMTALAAAGIMVLAGVSTPELARAARELGSTVLRDAAGAPAEVGGTVHWRVHGARIPAWREARPHIMVSLQQQAQEGPQLGCVSVVLCGPSAQAEP